MLYEALVKNQKIADAASADYDAVSAGEGSLDIFVQPKPGITLTQIEKAVEAEIEKLLKKGVNKKDFTRAKTTMLADDVYAQDDIFHTVYRLGLWLMAGGSVDTYDDWKTALEKLTPKEVLAAAKETFNKTNSTTGLLVGSEDQF